LTTRLFRTAVRIFNYQTYCTHAASDNNLIKVNSCNAFLRILLVRISTYRKAVLRYTFLI